MALEVGSRLGHYDVTALIGEGGMGQVYRATDTQLGRDVALKILPDAFAADPDRLARFQREAQVLASLNHPNIAQIHGIETSDYTQALVLELVEGPTLADRIAKGPIPLDEALPIAKQIAEALEAAHEAGVIHRDLKPANIKVREDGTVKVLDFGLAKALTPEPEGDPNQSPTRTVMQSKPGVILGTAAYMSPEQARGKPVDQRVDVWAFGCVLFEMLTGQQAIDATGAFEMPTEVPAKDGDPARVPADVPPRVRWLLSRCLVRTQKDRLRDFGEARIALRDASEAPSLTPPVDAPARPRPQPAASPRRTVVLLGSVVITAIVTSVVVSNLIRALPLPVPDPVRFVIDPPAEFPLSFSGIQRDLAISRDGTQIVYKVPVPGGGAPQFLLRPTNRLDGAPLRGTVDAVAPFFSPGGEWVGFVDISSATTLQKVSVLGGPPVTLTESPSPIMGTSWEPDDQIIFGTTSAGLFRVSGDGGVPEVLTTLRHDETSHRWPFVIPGHEAVAFVITNGEPLTTGQLAVVDSVTGEVTEVGLAGVNPHYVSTGHLVYAGQDGSLRAAPFDAASLEVTGNPVPLVDGVMVKSSGAADFGISDDGRLVYALGAVGSGFHRALVWVDEKGREEPIAAPLRNYIYPRIGPDGRRVALDIRDAESDIWVWDFAGETLTRLTFDASNDTYGHWTPDGLRVVFSSAREGPANVYWKAADATGPATRLTESDGGLAVNAVTPDGTQVVVAADGVGGQNDLFVVTLDSDRGSEALLVTEFDERNAALSPDGKWIAFESNASGRYEVYVRPFPDVESGQWPISAAGGRYPVWARHGRALFFLQGTQLMTASVQTGARFAHGTPEVVFEAPYFFGAAGRNYDVAPDGRFLMIKDGQSEEHDPSPRIAVVLHWFEELTERAPVN